MSNSFAIPWTVACQTPLCVGLPRQEYWSGLSFPSPRDLPDPGIGPRSPIFAGGLLISEPPGEARIRDTLSEKSKMQSSTYTIVEIKWGRQYSCAFI